MENNCYDFKRKTNKNYNYTYYNIQIVILSFSSHFQDFSMTIHKSNSCTTNTDQTILRNPSAHIERFACKLKQLNDFGDDSTVFAQFHCAYKCKLFAIRSLFRVYFIFYSICLFFPFLMLDGFHVWIEIIFVL